MLENFAGNEKLISIIENMLSSGHIPHAIMLEGENGLGKHTVAAALAKAILCEDSVEFCGECRSCKLFDAGTHPDYRIITSTNNLISVKLVRELRLSAYERPDRGNRKVYVIENAQLMNSEAQNAFLKVLEEPPEYVVFILLARSSSAFLDTVISRCTVLHLQAPEYAAAEKALEGMLQNADKSHIEAALSANDNNIGKALLQFEDGSASKASGQADLLLKCIAGRNAYGILKLLNKYERDPEEFALLLNLLQSKAAIELRNISCGKDSVFKLSKEDLFKLNSGIVLAQRYLKNNCLLPLVISRFAAGLI